MRLSPISRKGLLLQTIRLSGLMPETADSDEINDRKALRSAVLRLPSRAQMALCHRSCGSIGC
jgi:type IV secretion system protein VirB4